MEEEKKGRGRPSKGESALVISLNLKLSREVGKILKLQAFDRKRTPQELVREDIEKGIERRREEYDYY